MDTNIWKVHPIHKQYFGNTEGEIWSKKCTNGIVRGFIANGYQQIKINKLNIRRQVFIYECFEGMIDLTKFVVCHIDENINNNAPKNLILVTIGEYEKTLRSGCAENNIWKEHPLHRGYYANEDGYVWSNKTRRRIMGFQKKGDYQQIEINDIMTARHIFTYECFNGFKVDSLIYEVDHIDGNKDNTNINNLQMLTKTEHKRKTQLGRRYTLLSKSKAVFSYNLDENNEMINIKEYISLKSASKEMNIDRRALWFALKDGSKKCGDFFWQYKNQPDLDGEYWACLWDEKFRGIEISNKGRIKTSYGIKTYGTKTPVGYYSANIKRKGYQMHTLVCLAFHGHPPEPTYTSVDHIDEGKSNNTMENLRWATDQIQADNSHSIPVAAYDRNGTLVGTWKSGAEAARELNLKNQHISACIQGKLKTHGKLIWKRVDPGENIISP